MVGSGGLPAGAGRCRVVRTLPLRFVHRGFDLPGPLHLHPLYHRDRNSLGGIPPRLRQRRLAPEPPLGETNAEGRPAPRALAGLSPLPDRLQSHGGIPRARSPCGSISWSTASRWAWPSRWPPPPDSTPHPRSPRAAASTAPATTGPATDPPVSPSPTSRTASPAPSPLRLLPAQGAALASAEAVAEVAEHGSHGQTAP